MLYSQRLGQLLGDNDEEDCVAGVLLFLTVVERSVIIMIKITVFVLEAKMHLIMSDELPLKAVVCSSNGVSQFSSKLSLFGSKVSLFGSDVSLLGSDVSLFGSDVSLFGSDVFLVWLLCISVWLRCIPGLAPMYHSFTPCVTQRMAPLLGVRAPLGLIRVNRSSSTNMWNISVFTFEYFMCLFLMQAANNCETLVLSVSQRPDR